MALSDSENATKANQKIAGADEALCRAGIEIQTWKQTVDTAGEGEGALNCENSDDRFHCV